MNTTECLKKMAKEYHRVARIAGESQVREMPFVCDICGSASKTIRCPGCFKLMAEALDFYASKIDEHVGGST